MWWIYGRCNGRRWRRNGPRNASFVDSMAGRESFFLWLAFVWVWSETICSGTQDLVAKKYTTRNMNISEVGVILNHGEPSVIVALNAHQLGTSNVQWRRLQTEK